METLLADTIGAMIANVIQFMVNLTPGYYLLLAIFLVVMLMGYWFRLLREIFEASWR